MTTRNAAARGLGVAVVVFAGACGESVPTEPPGIQGAGVLFARSPQAPAAVSGTLDHEFARISMEIPGFGGLYYDASGTLNVVMAPVAEPLAQGELRSRLADRLQSLGHDPAAAGSMVVREGIYDFARLLEMRRRIDQVVWGLRGIVYTDADEVANRVTIGVENSGARASVEHAVAMLGLPAAAVTFHLTPPVSVASPLAAAPASGHTLQDHVRPVAGGLALRSSAPFFGFCAIGVNVRSPEAPGVHGFLTHGFCATEHYGTGPMGTVFWQPDQTVPGSRIGVEAHNAPPFTGGDCPPNPNPDWIGCRWSTAAGGRYDAGVDNAFGAIYRTTGTGSITIDPDRPMFEIVAERSASVVGQQAHKVGAESGWTEGPVIATCVNVGHSWSSPAGSGAITVLCQDRAEAQSVGFFDWGAPVFLRAAENEVELLGLVSFPFGTTVFYAPISQIRLENPPPPGRSWLTHP